MDANEVAFIRNLAEGKEPIIPQAQGILKLVFNEDFPTYFNK